LSARANTICVSSESEGCGRHATTLYKHKDVCYMKEDKFPQVGVYVDHQRLQNYGNRELLKIHDCKLNVQVCVLQSIRMFVFIVYRHHSCLRLHMCSSSALTLGPGAKERIAIVTVGELVELVQHVFCWRIYNIASALLL